MDSTVAAPNHIRFHGPCRRQNWSFRGTIIQYIAKNPSSSEVYQELICTCKYFYAKNPITVCKELIYDHKNQILEIREFQKTRKTLDLNNVYCKLWITYSFYVENEKSPDKRNFAATLIPHMFRCDVKWLSLWNQDISLKDYLFISKNAQVLDLRYCNIKNDDGSVVLIEKLVDLSPKALTFAWAFGNDDELLNISSESVKNLLKIPHFKNLNKFYLHNIPDTFDIGTFYDYIKKNQHTRILTFFSEAISEELQNRLETIVDEIFATAKDCNYRIPLIRFHGLDNEKFLKLRDLCLK